MNCLDKKFKKSLSYLVLRSLSKIFYKFFSLQSFIFLSF